MIACALFEPFALWQARREKPELQGKPLVTLEKGKVNEVSEEARALGVAPGMSLDGARAKCHDLSVVETDPVTLKQHWEALLAELYGFTDRLESPRPGLVFLELSETEAETVARVYGVDVGVARTKEEAHLKALADEDIDGAAVRALEHIGLSPKTIERLSWLGINELGQLRRWSKAHLSRYLGAEAKVVIQYLKGPFDSAVSRYVPEVKLSKSYSFEDGVLEPWQWGPVLRHLCQCLAEGLGDRAASRLCVSAEAAGVRFGASRLSKEGLKSEKVLRLARLALEDCGVLGLEVEKLTVELSGLYRPSLQGQLWRQRENIETARAKIEARFPGAALRVIEVNPYIPTSEFAYRLQSGSEVKGEGLGVAGVGARRQARPGGRQPRLLPH